MDERNMQSGRGFEITKTVCHGFPEKPSCMAYDSVQDLLAFGSLSGEVVILGRPGLEIRFETNSEVLHLQFSINKGLIVVYCSDQKCRLWSIKTSTPSLLSEFKLSSRDELTVLYWPYNSNTIYVGTKSGNVMFLVVNLTEVDGTVVAAEMLSCEETIYWNKVALLSHGARRDNPGEVKSIEEHPLEPEKVLIGYSYGLCVVWNLKKKEVEYRQKHENLESVTWYGGSGKTYVTCSSEGVITRVSLKKGEEKMLYKCPGIGSITNLQSYNIKQDKWLFFIQCTAREGTLSTQTQVVILGEKEVLTSIAIEQPVVDILCVPSTPFKAERQSSRALVVLQNKKLDVFDLQCSLPSQRVLPFSVPFSFTDLTSSISYLHVGGQCSSQAVVDKLMVLKSKFGHHDKHMGFSSNRWPFEGGETWRKELRHDALPELLITSQIDRSGSITVWLCYPDILEKMFTIETAQLFPLNYQNTSQDQPLSKRDTDEEPKSKGASLVDSERELDVKFVSVNMEEETVTLVNHRGNVLVYKLGLQPPHESPRSIDVLLNAVDEVDSKEPEDKSNQLSWRFWAGQSGDPTPHIHLLYHVYCVVDWEETIKVVPVQSAVYNSNIKMLLLGTHIAMVLADMENNGTIVIDTLKTLKSLALSSITSCETRTLVESKRKSGFLSKLGGKKAEKKPVPHDISPCCSSVVDIVFFTVSNRDQPYLTVWMGTESGELAVYKVLRNPSNNTEIQMNSTGILLKQKYPVLDLVFVNKNLEKINSNSSWSYSLPQSEVPPDESITLNYVIVQTKRSIKCYGFPSKKMIPLGKIKEDEGHEILKSFFTKCGGSCYVLSVASQGLLLVSSFPDLNPFKTISLASLMDLSMISTLTFTDKAQGMYVSRGTEIQRVAISRLNPEEDEADGAVSGLTHSFPSPYVPHHSPIKPDVKSSTFKIKKGSVASDRNSWFTPHRQFQRKEKGERGAATMPGRIGNLQNPYNRAAEALDERGQRLNTVLQTTSRLSELAEQYAENAALNRKKR